MMVKISSITEAVLKDIEDREKYLNEVFDLLKLEQSYMAKVRPDYRENIGEKLYNSIDWTHIAAILQERKQ